MSPPPLLPPARRCARPFCAAAAAPARSQTAALHSFGLQRRYDSGTVGASAGAVDAWLASRERTPGTGASFEFDVELWLRQQSTTAATADAVFDQTNAPDEEGYEAARRPASATASASVPTAVSASVSASASASLLPSMGKAEGAPAALGKTAAPAAAAAAPLPAASKGDKGRDASLTAAPKPAPRHGPPRHGPQAGPAAALYAELFEAVDSDGSGFLDEAEGKHFLRCSGCEEAQLDYYWADLVRTADTDRDGRVGKAEFLTHTVGNEDMDASGDFVDAQHEAVLRGKLLALRAAVVPKGKGRDGPPPASAPKGKGKDEPTPPSASKGKGKDAPAPAPKGKDKYEPPASSSAPKGKGKESPVPAPKAGPAAVLYAELFEAVDSDGSFGASADAPALSPKGKGGPDAPSSKGKGTTEPGSGKDSSKGKGKDPAPAAPPAEAKDTVEPSAKGKGGGKAKDDAAPAAKGKGKDDAAAKGKGKGGVPPSAPPAAAVPGGDTATTEGEQPPDGLTKM